MPIPLPDDGRKTRREVSERICSVRGVHNETSEPNDVVATVTTDGMGG